MKVLCLILPLGFAFLVRADRPATFVDGDRVTATTGVNLAKTEYSSSFQTSLKSGSSSNVALQVPHPPISPLALPKPPKLPSHPEVVDIPHPNIVTVSHPSAFNAHSTIPQVHLLKDDSHHLDVLELSNGLPVVPLDDHFGRVVDYLYLGSEINLLPAGDTFYLPATDHGHETFVNLGTQSGHLSLSEMRIGNTVLQGFQGIDEIGPVFIPIQRNSRRLVVNPVVYRTDRLLF